MLSSRTMVRALLVVMWACCLVPRSVRAQPDSALSSVVRWVLPPSRDCVVAECPRFVPTAAGEAGTVTQGVMFETLLPIPGELLITAPGEYRVVRRIGLLEETFVFFGPASIFLHADGSYEFISPGGGATGEESHPHSLLPHGLPPIIAGVEGTRFDYLITPEGMVYIRVANGLVRVRWWQEDWQREMLRGGEAMLLDPHDYGGARVTRRCGGGASCGRTVIRRFYGDDADARWTELKAGLDGRTSRTLNAHQALQAFRHLADEASKVSTLDVAQATGLYAAFTDTIVPCTPREIA